MRSAILLLAVLCVLSVASAEAGYQCVCSCCAGTGCSPTTYPAFSVSSCDNSVCTNQCATTYPTTCGAATGQAGNVCYSGAANLASNPLVYIAMIAVAYVGMKIAA